MSKKVKNGLIAGGLISTAGLFVAKLIGLAYTIPFSYILASDAYMGMYGGAYRIYSYLLQVFTAGFPFAIATLTTKYATGEHWGKVRAVQRLSTRILTIMGFIGMVIMWFIAPFIAGTMTTPDNVPAMIIVLIILGLALFVIPIVSSYRGYLEGLKNFSVYSKSQVIEQIIRVGFLLGVSCLIVFVLKSDRVWALYASVGSASVAGVTTLFYLRKYVVEVNKTLPVQKTYDKSLIKEIVLLAIPYMAIAVLGYMDDIISAMIIPDQLMQSSMYTNAEVETITSALNYAGTKLVAIPLILAPGFTASLIPHITEGITKNDIKTVKSHITQAVSTVIIIAIPVCAFIYLCAKPIYSLLFYTENLQLSTFVVQLLIIEGACCTVSPVMTNITMACGLRKSAIGASLVVAIGRIIGTILGIRFFGIAGAIGVSVLSHILLIFYFLLKLKKRYALKLRPIFVSFMIAILLSTVAWLAFVWVPLDLTSKFNTLITLGCAGVLYVLPLGLSFILYKKYKRKV